MSPSVGSTVFAVLLEEAKAARWGTFQRVCVRALERLGSLNIASASLLDIAQSHSWEVLLCLQLLYFLQVSCSLIIPSLQSRSKGD